jgi:hypothetical protein
MMKASGAVAIRRWSLLLGKLFALVLLLSFLALLIGYVSIFYAHHKAQQLVLAVQTLQAGKSTVEDAQKLVNHFGGSEYDARSYYTDENGDRKPQYDPCLGSSLSYSIDANPPVTLLRVLQAFPALQKLGLHPWMVGVAIHHKNGKVTCYSERIMFIRSDEHVIEGYAEITERNPQSLIEERPYQVDSFVSRRYYHETRVIVLTEASAEEKRRAFRTELSCTVGLRGCYFPCRITPLGWIDSVHDRRAHGWELPEGANDSRCPAH